MLGGTELKTVLARPDVQKKLTELGLDVETSTPAEFTQRMTATSPVEDDHRFDRLIKRSNLRRPTGWSEAEGPWFGDQEKHPSATLGATEKVRKSRCRFSNAPTPRSTTTSMLRGFPSCSMRRAGWLEIEAACGAAPSPAYPNGFPWMDPRKALSEKYTSSPWTSATPACRWPTSSPTTAGTHLPATISRDGPYRLQEFHVMGGCIGGSYCFEAIEQAPYRVAAAVLQNPIGLWEKRDNWDARGQGLWRNGAPARPSISQETVDSFGRNMFGSDFVFSVTRDFVKNCRTPLYLQPAPKAGIRPHQRRDRKLAPKIEVQKDWRGPEFLQESIRRVHTFLARNTPQS